MAALFSMKSTARLVTVLLLAISPSLSLSQLTAPSSTVFPHCSQASTKQAPIDLLTAIDEFVQSIPAGNTSGYADPKEIPRV